MFGGNQVKRSRSQCLATMIFSWAAIISIAERNHETYAFAPTPYTKECRNIFGTFHTGRGRCGRENDFTNFVRWREMGVPNTKLTLSEKLQAPMKASDSSTTLSRTNSTQQLLMTDVDQAKGMNSTQNLTNTISSGPTNATINGGLNETTPPKTPFASGQKKTNAGTLDQLKSWLSPTTSTGKKTTSISTKGNTTNAVKNIEDLVEESAGKSDETQVPIRTSTPRERRESPLSNPLSNKKEKAARKEANRAEMASTLSQITGNKIVNLNETVTYADLLSLLSSSQIMSQTAKDDKVLFQTTTPVTKLRAANTTPEGATSKGGVALPQQSKLTSEVMVRSTTVVSGFLAYLVSRSIQRNLWLFGFVAGSFYGNRVATQYTSIRERNFEGDGDLLKDMSRNVVDNFLLSCGKNVGQFYITVFDALNVMWYMYKTGELSYAYFKKYEALDQRLKITDKMDAWNARFAEGKTKFDQWEKENEVSRKVLAGLRTFWVLEDKSYKKYAKRQGKQVSKYRIVNVLNDIVRFVERFLRAIWKLVTGGGSKELDDLLLGIKIGASELNFEIVGQQIGSGLAAVLMLNLIGALFLVSPGLTGFLVFAGGWIWPTWIGGAYRRVTKTINETTEKGRRQVSLLSSASEGKYQFFVRPDGSKRWYRTGKPVLGQQLINSNEQRTVSVEATKTEKTSIFPWKRREKTKTMKLRY